MVGLFGAQQNSGINAGWVLLYLATSPEWRSIARTEIREVVNKHCSGSSKIFQEKLASLPLDVWENEFPMLYLCLKDSIRLHANGACFRRNMSRDNIAIGKEVIPPGSFTVYLAQVRFERMQAYLLIELPHCRCAPGS